jgi:hypothetical protein
MPDSDKFLEAIAAPFLVALLAKLLKYGDVPGRDGGPSDPTFLTEEQTTALAVEGVSLLARYLPHEAARQVASAVEHLARPPYEREQVLLQLGSLGAVVPDFGGDPGSAPGCCVQWPGRGLICARLRP